MKKSVLYTTLALGIGVAFAAVPNNTYVYMTSAEIDTLDPHQMYDTASGRPVENLYETLVTYKGKSVRELAPSLATEWKSANNGRQFTFTLRRNVKFHSGATMTCDDAEYSFERMLVTNNAESPNWFLSEPLLGFGNWDDDNKKSTQFSAIDRAVECNGSGQLVFTLKAPDPAFLAKLAFQSMAVVEKKYTAALGEWSGAESDWKNWVDKDLHGSKLEAKPNGTGAYQFVSKTANQSVYKAFNDYWGGKPKIENVIFQVVPELAARLEALKRGDADLVETGGRSTLPQVQTAPGVKVFDNIEDNSATAIFMNQNIKNPAALGSGKLDGKGVPANFFTDVNVRRGFAYAFDYDRYIKDVQVGKGEKRSMLLPASFPGYDAKVKTHTYNPELAKGYFQKAWGGQVWQNGFVLQARYRAGSVTSQTAMEILKANIEKINPKFKVELQAQQWPELLADARKGATAMILISWIPDYADPDNFLYTFYHSEGFYSPRSNISDKTLDKYLEQARVTTDATKRNALYSLVGQRAFDQAYFINVPAGIGFVAYRNNLKGLEENYNIMLSGGFRWKDLSK